MAEYDVVGFNALTGMEPEKEPETPKEPARTTSKKDLGALNYVVDNVDNPDYFEQDLAIRAGQKLGLNMKHIGAMRYAKELEDSYFKEKGYVKKPDITDKRIADANKIKNKIYDTIAMARPAMDIQGVPNVNRFMIKTFIDNSPDAQVEYLNRLGYQTRVKNGEVQVKNPGETRFSVIDPSDIDIWDATDVLGDIIEGGVIGAAGLAGGAIGGPKGAFLSGGAAAGLTEGLKQGLGNYLKMRNGLEKTPIIINTLTGGLTEAAMPALSQVFRKFGEKSVAAAGKMKDNAGKIIEKVKQAGLEPFFAQLADSPQYVKLFKTAKEGYQTIFNNKYLKQVDKAYTDAKQLVRGLIEEGDFRDASLKGSEIKEAFANDFGKLLAPVEELYDKSLNVLSKEQYAKNPSFTPANDEVIGGFKRSILREIDDIADSPAYRMDKQVVKYFDEIRNAVGEIENVSHIKDFRTFLRNSSKPGQFTRTPMADTIVAQLTPKITDIRSQAMNMLAKSHNLDAKIKIFDDMDRVVSQFPKIDKEYDFYKEEVLDALYAVDELKLRPGMDLYNMLNSPEINTLKNTIDEYVDVVGNGLDKNSDVFLKLKDNYNSYIKNYAEIESAINDLSKADILYKDMRVGLNALLSKSGTQEQKGLPKQIFETYLEKLPPNDVINRVLNTKNIDKAEAIQAYYPDAFESLRKAKIGEMFRSVEKNNEINTTEFTRAIKKLSDEEKILLFGKDWKDKSDGLVAFLENIPGPLNTSGTDIRNEFRNALDWKNNIKTIIMSKFQQSKIDKLQKVIETQRTPQQDFADYLNAKFIGKPRGMALTQGVREGALLLPSKFGLGQDKQEGKIYAPTK